MHASAILFKFGPFTFHDATGQFMHRGTELHLSSQARNLLRQLLWSWPRPLEREQCRDLDVVDELYAILGAESRDSLITHTVETITGPPLAGALLLPGGARHPLYAGENSVGRADDNSIVLDDVRISRRHAQITVLYGRAWIRDLGSKNGTFVAGHRIATAPVLITRRSPLCFGNTSASIVLHESDVETSERAEPEERRTHSPRSPAAPILHVPLW